MAFTPASSGGGGASLVAPAYVGMPWGATAQGLGNTQFFTVGVWVPVAATFSKIGYRIITQSGNMWLAVYNTALARIAQITSFAMPANGPSTIPGSLALTPGNYWLAVQFDGAVATLACSGGNLGQPNVCFSTTNTYASGPPATLTFTAGSATGPCLALIV